MLSNEDLEKAVAGGVISADQAAKLRAMATVSSAEYETPITPEPDEERFRILGGFNDIFVTIGLFLLIAALYSFAGLYGSFLGFSALSAVMAWSLSEIFARRLRLALPSIVLAVMFATSACFTAAFWLNFEDWISTFFTQGGGGRQIVLISLCGAAAAALHLWRFRVPINAAQIAFYGVGAFAGVLALLFGSTFLTDYHNGILFVCGLAVFLTAMRLDMSDRLRVTRRADMAFWLHLLAAPLLIHPIVAITLGDALQLTGMQAVSVLIVFAALSLFALIIDRRAILVSALVYAGMALGYLIEQTASSDLTLPITLVLLATIVLSLSAGWHRLRSEVVNRLPPGRLRDIIPPAVA